MENDVTEKELIIYGSTGKTVVVIGKDNLCIYTMEGLEKKIWDGEKIYRLLEDGTKYRLLKKAEEIKKNMLTE